MFQNKLTIIYLLLYHIQTSTENSKDYSNRKAIFKLENIKELPLEFIGDVPRPDFSIK